MTKGTPIGAPPALVNAAVLPTSMTLLAFIVIAFLGETWGEIEPSRRWQAFVLINASGAHAILSGFFSFPAHYLSRKSPSATTTLAGLAGFFTYGYWALLIQHYALTMVHLDREWKSIFLFADSILPMLQDTGNEIFIYTFPLLFAWGAYILVLGILLIIKFPIVVIKKLRRH